MASRKWLSWLMSCGLLISGGLMEEARAQDGYSYGGDAYSSYGGYDPGAMIPGTPPGPYDGPIAKDGSNPYWVAPTPQSPQIFSSGDGIGSAFRSYDGFFFRAEYLQFDYTRPGDVLLGAPQFGFIDPRLPFEVFDGGGNSLGFAQIPNLDDFKLRNVPGVRATVGVPLIFGSAEASIFGMNTAQDAFEDVALNGTLQQPFLGTTTFVNGGFSDAVQLYNDSFRATFTSRVWSAEANVFFDGPSSNFFSFSPMIGFKYFDLREDLEQRGVFTPAPGTGLPSVHTTINSYSDNQLFTPQIGLRTKFENRFGAIIFDPKFGLAANVFSNKVNSNNFRSNADPFVESTSSGAQLSPVIDLNLTGRLKLTQSLFLTVGYNFIFTGHVTRPQDNIIYNDNVPFPTPPDIHLRTHKQDMIFQGLTIGAEYRLP